MAATTSKCQGTGATLFLRPVSLSPLSTAGVRLQILSVLVSQGCIRFKVDGPMKVCVVAARIGAQVNCDTLSPQPPCAIMPKQSSTSS